MALAKNLELRIERYNPELALFNLKSVRAGYEPTFLKGPARVFDSEPEAHQAVHDRKIVEGDIVVIRYEGPVGGPGMQEMLGVTAAIQLDRQSRIMAVEVEDVAAQRMLSSKFRARKLPVA